MSIRNYICVLAFAGSFYAHAQGLPEWVAVATACVPDEASTGRFTMTDGRLYFAGQTLGEIQSRCNVTNPRDNNLNPLWSRLEITYSDPDGMAGAAQVTAQLIEVDKFTGGSLVVTTFNSNAFPAMPLLRSIPFNHVFNFINKAYYVDVRVRRATANWAPWVARVRLYRD